MLVKAIVMIILTQIFVSYGISQWRICNYQTGGTPNAIFFTDDNTGYVTNVYPLIHKTTDKGKTPLRHAKIDVPDIRAGFSYLVAAILAKGESLVNGIHYIDRGYEKIDQKMRKLGVNIKRV